MWLKTHDFIWFQKSGWKKIHHQTLIEFSCELRFAKMLSFFREVQLNVGDRCSIEGWLGMWKQQDTHPYISGFLPLTLMEYTNYLSSLPQGNFKHFSLFFYAQTLYLHHHGFCQHVPTPGSKEPAQRNLRHRKHVRTEDASHRILYGLAIEHGNGQLAFSNGKIPHQINIVIYFLKHDFSWIYGS